MGPPGPVTGFPLPLPLVYCCYVMLVPERTQYGNLCGKAWNIRVVLCSLALFSGRLLPHLTKLQHNKYLVYGFYQESEAEFQRRVYEWNSFSLFSELHLSDGSDGWKKALKLIFFILVSLFLERDYPGKVIM